METKKTETLDSVLVAKNFYRVRDAYAIKLYGQDEGMSFDVAGQRLFGSNIAIKDGLLYGSSLGDLTIEAYFQGGGVLPFRGYPKAPSGQKSYQG
ncbi:hypothetical protein PF616_09830 [Streptococcus thermophilus]|nr:hypothetical protein [Streptococcus thermophilus]MDA3770607.1 hypothetical protein [Streptococcus thermophilus]